MKLFYLNTLHLTHLARKNYSSLKEPLTLAQKFQKKNIVLLYSGTHIREIASHSSSLFVERMGQFMESLPHLWIKDLEERIKEEVFVSWKCFKAGTAINLTPLCISPLLTSVCALESHRDLHLDLSNKTLSETLRYARAIREVISHKNEADSAFSLWLNKGPTRRNGQTTKRLNGFRKCLEERIKALLYHSLDSPRSFQQFLNHLVSHPELIKSFWMELYAEHTQQINSEIEHSSVAPYAHYFSCSQRVANFIYTSKNWSNLQFIKCKILKNLPEVENFLA